MLKNCSDNTAIKTLINEQNINKKAFKKIGVFKQFTSGYYPNE